MEPPRSYKDVQKLIGRLTALSRFISKSGDRNLPFFKKLRQASKEEFVWDSQCDATFEELKQYLGCPKLLTRPEEGEELQLYLAISEGAVSSVLLREEQGIQKPIYYISHVLHEPEENDPLINKFFLALIVYNPGESGRLTTWAIELSEFEINYAPHAGVKAQILADFILKKSSRSVPEKHSRREVIMEAPKWMLYVDGASNNKGARAEILIQGVEGEQFEYVLRYSFKATNNEVEYEAMVARLQMAKALDISRLRVRGDSKLVIEQVQGDCGVKNDVLKKYHAKALLVVQAFEYVIFEDILRTKNEHAYHLSWLATTYYEEMPSHVRIEIKEAPAYEEIAIMRVMEEEEHCRSPIARFILTREL
ncbi:hypothetical protein LIER_01357 [Lithospermum erythrorhizon]|uniref:RNase H type-1 domain-containing protein n=1 Tax=Lithospermum erythrorhizon TaxID=34254 RepID=A0AAV3NLN2_LITER